MQIVVEVVDPRLNWLVVDDDGSEVDIKLAVVKSVPAAFDLVQHSVPHLEVFSKFKLKNVHVDVPQGLVAYSFIAIIFCLLEYSVDGAVDVGQQLGGDFLN